MKLSNTLNRIIFPALIVVIVFLVCFDLQAQHRRSRIGIGVSAGLSNYKGDLDDNFTPKFTRLGCGAHAMFIIFPCLNLRLGYYHASLYASDLAGTFAGNANRGLSFSTNIDEFSASILIKPLPHQFGRDHKYEPYFLAGIGIFHFNPMAEYNGRMYDLHAIGTEGQYLHSGFNAEPYKLTQLCLPIGFGIIRRLNIHWDFGFETGFRKLFTDYLDDVSSIYPDPDQMISEMGPVAAALADRSNRDAYPGGRSVGYMRGNAMNMDWYVYTNAHITYYITSFSGRGKKGVRHTNLFYHCVSWIL